MTEKKAEPVSDKPVQTASAQSKPVENSKPAAPTATAVAEKPENKSPAEEPKLTQVFTRSDESSKADAQ